MPGMTGPYKEIMCTMLVQHSTNLTIVYDNIVPASRVCWREKA